jgi:hypothetical protein
MTTAIWFSTKAPKHFIGEKLVYSKNGVEKTGYPHVRLKIDPYFSSYTKIHSKWIKDINMRPENLKLLKGNIGKTLADRGVGNTFLNRTPSAQ